MVKFTQILQISENSFLLRENRARQPDDGTATFLQQSLNLYKSTHQESLTMVGFLLTNFSFKHI